MTDDRLPREALGSTLRASINFRILRLVSSDTEPAPRSESCVSVALSTAMPSGTRFSSVRDLLEAGSSSSIMGGCLGAGGINTGVVTGGTVGGANAGAGTTIAGRMGTPAREYRG